MISLTSMQGSTGLGRIVLLGVIVTLAAQAQTTLGVSPQQVSFASPAGSVTPISRTVTILSSGQPIAFNASVRYLGTTTGWLSVNPPSGTTPADLTISANPSTLPAGTYLGQVTISAGSTLGAVVNVFFTVESGSGSGAFVAIPTSMTFLGQSGQPTLPSQTLTITSPAGPGAMFDAFASSAGNWLSVLPAIGTTPGTVTVGASQAGLAAGTYTGAITITPRPSGNPTVVPVTLVATGVNLPTTKLILFQSLVTFHHQVSQTVPTRLQIVQVDTPDEFLEYKATVSQNWLKLITPFAQTPATTITGFSPGYFGVLLDATEVEKLPVGSYSAEITVEVPGLASQKVSATLTVSNGPGLNPNPSSVIFNYTTGASLPEAKSIEVTSTGTNALSFTVASSAPWLRVTPASASTASGSAELQISVAPAGLGAGTYTGLVTLTVQGGTVFSIPVTLNVSASSQAGDIEVSTEELEFTGITGNTVASQTVLATTGELGRPHSFTAAASSTEGWLTVAPFMGTTPAPLTVSVNTARLTRAGTYQGRVIVTSLLTGTQKEIGVSFTLAQPAIAAEPATLTFTQERRGESPPPQSIRITSNTPSTFTVSGVPAWIRVTPMSGSTPGTAMVWPELSALPPGTTGATIVISAASNRITVPVSVVLLPAPAPTATPESLTFTHQLGSPVPASRSITVGSTTGEPVAFIAASKTESGGNWLSVTPASGMAPSTITAAVNTAQLVPGKYTGTIAIAAPNATEPSRTVAVSLTVTAANTVLERILHGATFAPTPIAPGQIVTITGTGFGPVSGVTAKPTAAGAFETRLADVRVLFDGVAAPLLYVGADQINAIVPYAVYGRLSARVQVESGASLSIPIEAKVTDSAPGIFTAAGLGRGPAAALNSDFTSNSPSNPAARGSIITIFGTGEGQTEPQGQDGRVILNDLRRPLLPVTARIGGRSAEVIYAGSAATLVSGVFQANVRVPEDIETGNVPLEILVGGAPAQSGVTIAVR